jgi:hypothetical protein
MAHGFEDAEKIVVLAFGGSRGLQAPEYRPRQREALEDAERVRFA